MKKTYLVFLVSFVLPLASCATYDPCRPFGEYSRYKPEKTYYYGYKTADGKTIAVEKFTKAHDYEKGLAFVCESISEINDKCGFIDTSGNYVIGPRDGREIDDFSEGLALLKDRSKFGFIDRTGNYLIKPHFDEVKDFHDGSAAVKIKQKWGYIDYKGNYVVNPHYNDAQDFSHGLAAVRLGGKWGYINNKGHMVITAQFAEAKGFSQEGLAPVMVATGYWGYINKKGAFVIKPELEDAEGFSEGLASVKMKTENASRWGYIDLKGNVAIKPVFLRANKFKHGYALVKGGGKMIADYYYEYYHWSMIDRTGKHVLDGDYRDIIEISHKLKLLKVEKIGGEEAIINFQGKVVYALKPGQYYPRELNPVEGIYRTRHLIRCTLDVDTSKI